MHILLYVYLLFHQMIYNKNQVDINILILQKRKVSFGELWYLPKSTK